MQPKPGNLHDMHPPDVGGGSGVRTTEYSDPVQVHWVQKQVKPKQWSQKFIGHWG